jgi:hypothetical protein
MKVEIEKAEILHITVLIISAYILRELWNALPASANTAVIYPFPFAPDQPMPPTTLVWIASIYGFFVIVFYVLGKVLKHWVIDIVFYLQFAELFEFFMNYNRPWCKVGFLWGMNLNVTNLRFITLLVCLIIVILKRR